MANNLKKVGISGGTFDPIHNGHLMIAQEIRDKYNLDRVLFIPSGTPPHKNLEGVTSPQHRYRMAEIAISKHPYFELSDIEIKRQGYTYTIDTLKQLKEHYGDTTELFFIIGADVVMDLMTWKNFEEVFKMCSFIAVLRPGYDKSSFFERIEFLKSGYMARISVTEAALIDISSTLVREKVKNGETVRHLIPGEVEEYILENGLYGRIKAV